MPSSNLPSSRSWMLLGALIAALWFPAVAAADPTEREERSRSDAEGGSLDGLFGDVGGWFGDDGEESELSRLEEGDDYGAIIADRPRSLRIFHGYATGITPRPELNGYVNGVLKRLVAELPVRNLPAQAYVMGSDSLSAAAAPCGAIAVDWGLLRALETEDELAFVLAHELAHVLFRHHTADWFVDAQHVSVSSGELAEEVVDKVEQTGGLSIDPSGKLSRAVKIGRVSYHLSKAVLLPAWTREQEDVADRFAIDLLVKAGYNHAAALTFFAKLDAWEKQMADPETGDPVALMLENAGHDPASWNDPDALFDSLLDNSGVLIDSLFGSEDHYPALERRDGVQEYVLELYKKARLPRNTPLPWAENGAGGQTAELHGLYRNAYLAFNKLREGETGSAEQFAGKSISKVTWSDGYPRLAFYQVRLAQNQPAKAQANIDFALEAPQPGVLLFTKRLQIAEDAGEWGEAARILDDARRRLDDPPALLPARIRIYPQVGRGHELTPTLLECRLAWSDQAEACEKEMEKSRL